MFKYHSNEKKKKKKKKKTRHTIKLNKLSNYDHNFKCYFVWYR